MKHGLKQKQTVKATTLLTHESIKITPGIAASKISCVKTEGTGMQSGIYPLVNARSIVCNEYTR